MRSNTARIALAVGAIAALVVLFVVLNGGSDSKDSSTSTTSATTGTTSTTSTGAQSTTPKPAPPTVISVRGGKPFGGIEKLDYTKGEQVRFRVDSDVSDEIHVHGYDFHKDVEAGHSVSFSFPAKIEGIFEIELESRGVQIAELTVNPS